MPELNSMLVLGPIGFISTMLAKEVVSMQTSADDPVLLDFNRKVLEELVDSAALWSRRMALLDPTNII